MSVVTVSKPDESPPRLEPNDPLLEPSQKPYLPAAFRAAYRPPPYATRMNPAAVSFPSAGAVGLARPGKSQMRIPRPFVPATSFFPSWVTPTSNTSPSTSAFRFSPVHCGDTAHART